MRRLNLTTEQAVLLILGAGIAIRYLLDPQLTATYESYGTAIDALNWQSRYHPMSVYAVALLVVEVLLVLASTTGRIEAKRTLWAFLTGFWVLVGISALIAWVQGSVILTAVPLFWGFAGWHHFAAQRLSPPNLR